MGSFLSAILGGSNPTLSEDTKLLGQQGGYDTGEGESDINAGTTFLKDILGGDATKQAQVLAPQISAAKKAAQQSNKTTAEMGTRSGGTGAATAETNDKVHSDITNLIARLTGTAATALPSIGTTLTSQGTAATDEQSKLAQQQLENWQNSILGKGIGSAVGAAESFGLGHMLPSGPASVTAGTNPAVTPGIDYGPPPDVDLSPLEDAAPFPAGIF